MFSSTLIIFQAWDDSTEEERAKEVAYDMLRQRFAADVESTGGQHVRAWKKILRDRVRAELHRQRILQAYRERKSEDPDACLPSCPAKA